jgi:signal transduction histidine kinase
LGVGLSICRTIIVQHQGRIWTEMLADGTAFCFTLKKAPSA